MRTLIASVLLGLLALAAPSPARQSIVVGSKNFAENRLLGEMAARLVEARTQLEVERRLGLAGTKVCFEALRTGAIDLYPEYTGTGLVTLMGGEPGGGSVETLNRVRAHFLERWDLWWLAPLGFENAYELAVPRALAAREGLRSISDLVRVAPDLTAGFGYEFVGRADGLPGLKKLYGLEFGQVLTMQQTLKYQAAGAGRVGCLDVYTTDGRLLVHDLEVLEDDRDFFPPYEAALLVRGETLRRHPELAPTLALLAGAFDEQGMRRLNLRVEEQGESLEAVAQDALEHLGLVAAQAGVAEVGRRRGLAAYVWGNRRTLATHASRHLLLTGLALALGIALAVPLGLALERRRALAEPIIRGVGITQTIPSIALLAFMIPLFGVGFWPALVALWIYSVFPILRNTYTGVRDAAPDVVESARALGMTDVQVLFRVRLPLAASVLMAGVRTAAVLSVGTATLAAFIGAGGLGVPIVSGLQLNDTTVILSGALPAAVLAVLADGGLALVERWLRPRGLEARS